MCADLSVDTAIAFPVQNRVQQLEMLAMPHCGFEPESSAGARPDIFPPDIIELHNNADVLGKRYII